MSGSLTAHPALTEAYTAEYLEYNGLLPLLEREGVLDVAVHGDPDPEALQDLEDAFGLPLELIPVEHEALREGIRRAFAASETVVELVRDLSASADSASPDVSGLTDARAAASQPPVIRFVNLLLREAQSAEASDIHLEATPEGLRVRLRIDGILTDLAGPPLALQAAVISRLKLLAELDIAERRAPQDGRVRVRLDTRELDLRVSTLPTLHGESVVLRLLDRGGQRVSLSELGMAPAVHAAFHRAVTRPHGIVLVCGPTGSGKTTTQYASLALRSAAEEKIITIEDPVEYHLTGVTQVPVHARAGVSFATALRSILRQDPDVLMIGEMRDAETAAIAVQAAMTGHLVLSTLHTNDAVSALTRLVDLKVEPYMVAATVEAVLSQRLIRRSCPECRERYAPAPEAVALVGELPNHALHHFVRGAGCPSCRGTGFRGRSGIFELLLMTDEVRRVLLESPDVSRLRCEADRQGMTTLREDAWAKVLAGITTVEEVLRVIQC